jgi:hypothetical protein
MMTSKLCSLCVLALALCSPAARTRAQAATPPAAAAVAAPATATPATPAAPAPTAGNPAASVAPAPSEPAAPVVAAEPAPVRATPTWTHADVARVRAMLRAQRAGQAQSAAGTSPPIAMLPAIHGDAGAAIAVSLNIDSIFYYEDAGYDLFAEDDVTPRFGLSIGYDVLAFARDMFLAAELGWGYETEDEHGVLSRMKTELNTHTFYAGASLRYVLWPWLQPQARLAAGASVLDFEAQISGEPRTSDRGVAPFASLGAGVLLRTPTRSFENHHGELASLSVGLLVEAGYAVRSGVSFQLGEDPGKHAIPVAQASLGELSLSGPYVRTSLVTRF